MHISSTVAFSGLKNG